jgi:gliding motility-associated-like protein
LTSLNTTIESLVIGSSRIFIQEYRITQIDINNELVTNIAKAEGLTPNEIVVSDSDKVVIAKSIVLACGNVVVHNAFSPNGDGFNESFTIDSLEDTICYPENTVEIYNRWGVLVFETTGYNNGTNSFDGTSRGRTTISQSSGLPTDTYFYILNYTSVDGTGQIQTNKQDGYLYLTK